MRLQVCSAQKMVEKRQKMTMKTMMMSSLVPAIFPGRRRLFSVARAMQSVIHSQRLSKNREKIVFEFEDEALPVHKEDLF